MKPRVTTRSRRATSSRREHVPISIAAATVLAINLVLLTAAPRSTVPAGAAGKLTVALAEDVVLDPHRGGMPASWVAARLIHRGLYAFPHAPTTEGSTPVPDLALALPEVVGSGLYDIDVRTAAFSDATALTLTDVVASVQRLIRSRVGVSRFLAPIERIRIVGPLADQRIRIEASRPMPELAWILAHPQAAILGASTPERVQPLGPPGLGPYRVASRSLQRRISLVRNLRWIAADDPVRAGIADRIELEVVGSGPAALGAVAAGAAQLIGDAGPPDVFARSAPVRPGGRCTRLIAVDQGASGLDRLAARRRIQNALLDVDLTTQGTRPALGILPPFVTGARTTAFPVSSPTSGIARTLTLAGSDSVRDARELTTIAEELRDAGLSVRVERRAPQLHARLLTAPSIARPDLLLFTWCSEWPGLAGRTFLEPLTGSGQLAPRSSTLSSAIARARTAAPEDALAGWRAVEAALHAAAILIPVGWPAEIAAFDGFTTTPRTSPMFPAGDPSNLDPAS
jgi:ABC-type transport system substrate-binding protein